MTQMRTLLRICRVVVVLFWFLVWDLLLLLLLWFCLFVVVF